MRELIVMKRAQNAIYKVAVHLAEENFPDTGEKFVNEVIDFCFHLAHLSKIEHPLCRNIILAKHHYSCAVFKKKWIIAFKYSGKEFKVYRFIYGPRLN